MRRARSLHRLAPLAPLAPLAALALVTGCEAILGIPSEVSRQGPADGAAGDALVEASPELDAGLDAADAPADSTLDREAAPPACDSTKNFAAPKLVASLSTAAKEGTPRFTEDELTVYFDGERDGGLGRFDLYTATRKSIDDDFGPPTPIPGVNSAINDFAPNLTPDGLTIIFERQNPLSLDSNIFRATRLATTDPFDPPAEIANLNTADYEATPFTRGSADEIWFVTSRGGVPVDIQLATFVSGTGYTVSTPANVNSPGFDDLAPILSADKLALYFSSDRPLTGFASYNVWVSTRSTPTGVFSEPIPVPNVNSNSSDEPSWISKDGCRLYVVSNRPGGAGGQDIYVAARPK